MPLVNEVHEGPTIIEYIDGRVIDCTKCGFKHIIPLPSAEELRHFYEEEFYQNEKDTYLEASAEDAERKASEFLRRYKTAEQILPVGGQRRVLDIGCGPGDFLALGKSLGWNELGIEPSSVAADYGRKKGLTIRNEFFSEEIGSSLGEFDFIHMSEVLEHVPNPSEMLGWAHSLLVPGGVLCISVPNDFSPAQKVLLETGKHKPWWVVPDHHLNYFDFLSLERLIGNVGLRVRERTTNFPMELFMLMGQDYTTDSALGSQFHSWRKNFDLVLTKLNPKLLDDFYKSLAHVELGRLAVVFAQKPLA